jgi:putative lipoic acid-binding regulatory protein
VFQDNLAISEIAPSVRETPGGRHVSVTINPVVQSADDVLRIYAELQSLEGVVMLI